MARIAVLGGGGFLGQHVMRLARNAGHEAVSLSRREGHDLADLADVTTTLACLQPDTIINCAAHVGSVHYVARHAADVVHDNLLILLHIYRAVQLACPTATVIHPISNCSYPGESAIQCESEWWQGPVHESVLSYGTPRRMIPVLAKCYHRQHGIKSVNWLVANAYGPGDSTDPDRVHALNGIILRMILAQQAGLTSFEIWGSGKPVREWCYVEDAARILVESVDSEEQIDPVNLAQNRGHSILEIARVVAALLEYDVEFRFNHSYADGASVKILDDRRFRALRPEFAFTPLEDGIRRTIEYYQQRLTRVARQHRPRRETIPVSSGP